MYKILSNEESMKVLRASYLRYACRCCPPIPDPAEKVKSFSQIVGVYPVKSDAWERFKMKFRDYIYVNICDTSESLSESLRGFVSNISEEEFLNNKLDKERFETLKEIIKYARETLKLNIKLMRNSPKFSNFLASILKYCGDNPDNHELMKNFNDRGSAQFSEFEMVISTEPHRIAGMSAYGVFTSCQDWIEKDSEHGYHHYTHSAWANLLDETVGIIYLRRVSDQAPSVDRPDAADMLARRLIRIAELPNGQNVLYIHQMYAHAPYDRYLDDTLERWKKTLPDNFHYFDMQDYNWDRFRNKHGIKYSGTRTFTHKQKSPYVQAAEVESCEYCDGDGIVESICDSCDEDGYITKEKEVECEYCEGTGEDENGDTCWKCDGDGWYETEYEEECQDCSGSGYVYKECPECYGEGQIYIERDFYPYNDHGSWLNLESHYGIQFTVPECYLRWDEKPEPKTTKLDGKYLPQVGDKVRIRPDLPRDWRKLYTHRNGETNTINIKMWELRGKIATIVGTASTSTGTQFKIDLDDGRWNWVDEMFDTTIRVGDIVALRPDLEVGKMYDKLTLHPQMYTEEIRSGKYKVIRVEKDTGSIKIRGDYTYDHSYYYSPNMLYLVEPRTEVEVDEEIEQATV